MQSELFEWDDGKAAANKAKHGVAFEDAVCVFEDEAMKTVDEQDENSEIRYRSIGMGCNGFLLLVVWTFRGDCVRIISAWKANNIQRKNYGK